MMGGDMPDNSPFVENLLTNEEVIQVNQKAKNARQLFRENGKVIWTSEDSESNARYAAVFNLNDQPADISIELVSLGFPGKCKIRDLWQKKNLEPVEGSFSVNVNPHGAKIFKVSPVN
jgi:hypothetical protein